MATLGGANETPAPAQTRHEASPEKLDVLLEQYLQLLDQYQSMREDLSKGFSCGFIAIAQANFNATNRMRFGQDYYDQRMQARRVINVNTADDGSANFSVVPTNPSKTPEPLQEKQHIEQTSDPTVESTATNATADNDSGRSDPVRWFGILVPQALRTAQSHFVDVMQHNVAQLTSIDAQMKILEIEIRRTKKHISKSRP